MSRWHALQFGARAEDEGADDELVVAPLLLNFGRLVGEEWGPQRISKLPIASLPLTSWRKPTREIP